MSNKYKDAPTGKTDKNTHARTYLTEKIGVNARFVDFLIETFCDKEGDILDHRLIHYIGGFQPPDFMSVVEDTTYLEDAANGFKKLMSFHSYANRCMRNVVDDGFDWDAIDPVRMHTHHKRMMDGYRKSFHIAILEWRVTLLEIAQEENNSSTPTMEKSPSLLDLDTAVQDTARNGGDMESRPVYSGESRMQSTSKHSNADFGNHFAGKHDVDEFKRSRLNLHTVLCHSNRIVMGRILPCDTAGVRVQANLYDVMTQRLCHAGKDALCTLRALEMDASTGEDLCWISKPAVMMRDKETGEIEKNLQN